MQIASLSTAFLCLTATAASSRMFRSGSFAWNFVDNSSSSSHRLFFDCSGFFLFILLEIYSINSHPKSYRHFFLSFVDFSLQLCSPLFRYEIYYYTFASFSTVSRLYMYIIMETDKWYQHVCKIIRSKLRVFKRAPLLALLLLYYTILCRSTSVAAHSSSFPLLSLYNSLVTKDYTCGVENKNRPLPLLIF